MSPVEGSSETRILEVALSLFAERGYAAASAHAIAEQVGMSKASVFHHFACKRDLYTAVMRVAGERAAHLLDALESDRGTTVQRLERFSKAHLRSLLDDRNLVALVLRDVLDSWTEAGHTLAGEVYGTHFGRLVEILRAGQRLGQLRDDVDPNFLATLVLGVNVFFVLSQNNLRHFPDGDFADRPEAFCDGVMKIILEGVAARPPVCEHSGSDKHPDNP